MAEDHSVDVLVTVDKERIEQLVDKDLTETSGSTLHGSAEVDLEAVYEEAVEIRGTEGAGPAEVHRAIEHKLRSD